MSRLLLILLVGVGMGCSGFGNTIAGGACGDLVWTGQITLGTAPLVGLSVGANRDKPDCPVEPEEEVDPAARRVGQ